MNLAGVATEMGYQTHVPTLKESMQPAVPRPIEETTEVLLFVAELGSAEDPVAVQEPQHTPGPPKRYDGTEA